jgi:hypothetical protein
MNGSSFVCSNNVKSSATNRAVRTTDSDKHIVLGRTDVVYSMSTLYSAYVQQHLGVTMWSSPTIGDL